MRSQYSGNWNLMRSDCSEIWNLGSGTATCGPLARLAVATGLALLAAALTIIHREDVLADNVPKPAGASYQAQRVQLPTDLVTGDGVELLKGLYDMEVRLERGH